MDPNLDCLDYVDAAADWLFNQALGSSRDGGLHGHQQDELRCTAVLSVV
jgi:hypothetical protein